MADQTGRGEPFFYYYAWALLAFVIAAFGGKAIFDAKDLPPLTWLHHVHALAMLSWFVLFAAQPTLIRRGQISAHRAFGRASPAIVLAFLTFSIMISKLNWARKGEPLIVTANSVNLVGFVGLYIAAILWRRDAATHKRLMLYATIMLIGPAAGRVAEIFDLSPLFAIPLVLALQIAPVIRDVIVRRRAHPAAIVGLVVSLSAIPLILGLAESPAWAAFVESVLGAPGGPAN